MHIFISFYSHRIYLIPRIRWNIINYRDYFGSGSAKFYQISQISIFSKKIPLPEFEALVMIFAVCQLFLMKHQHGFAFTRVHPLIRCRAQANSKRGDANRITSNYFLIVFATSSAFSDALPRAVFSPARTYMYV